MAAQTPIPRLSHQSNQMRPKSFLVSRLVILDRLFDLFDRSFPSGSEGIERPYPLGLEVSSSGEKGLETVEFGLVDFASGCSVVETRLVTLFIVFFFFFLFFLFAEFVKQMGLCTEHTLLCLVAVCGLRRFSSAAC